MKTMKVFIPLVLFILLAFGSGSIKNIKETQSVKPSVEEMKLKFDECIDKRIAVYQKLNRDIKQQNERLILLDGKFQKLKKLKRYEQ